MTKIGCHDENFMANAKRRMPDYRGANESRPQPRSTKSDMGGEAEKMQRILRHHADAEIKLGERTFMSMDEKGYQEWYPRDGGTWYEQDLPVAHHALRSVSGVLLDIKKSKDKLILATQFPEFVLQMLLKAAGDYLELLEEPMKVLQIALIDYGKYLCQSDALSGPERVVLMSDRGLAALSDTPDFEKFFVQWKRGSFQDDIGTIVTTPRSIMNAFKRQLIEPGRLSTVWRIARTLGVLSLQDHSAVSFDPAQDLGLNTKSVTSVSKVEYFIIHDPSFRYFVDGAGGGKGSRVHYWDWVRNSAEAISEFKSQF